MNFILIAVLVLGAIALIAALVLFGVSKKFAVEEDPRLGQVGEILPLCDLDLIIHAVSLFPQFGKFIHGCLLVIPLCLFSVELIL